MSSRELEACSLSVGRLEGGAEGLVPGLRDTLELGNFEVWISQDFIDIRSLSFSLSLLSEEEEEEVLSSWLDGL